MLNCLDETEVDDAKVRYVNLLSKASWPEVTDISRIRQRTFSTWDWVLRFTERQKCKFNMADKRSVRIDYNQLHHMSSELLYETKPRKRLVKKYPKTFQVERIIARRTTKKVRNMLDINILILYFNNKLWSDLPTRKLIFNALKYMLEIQIKFKSIINCILTCSFVFSMRNI